jgi:UDP-N-acetyl-2-amino-2-deoxyglucuronate dehydrogenase
MTQGQPEPTYGWGIVGCGVIAPTHVRAIAAQPGARLVGVTDIEPAKATAFAAAHGVTAYPDLDALLADPAVAIVSVCVPSGLHAEIGVRAAAAGKHVVIEKPIDVTLPAADRLIAAVADAGTKMTVISQHRFDPGHIRARDQVQSGALGRLVLGEAAVKWYRSQAYYDSGAWRGTWELDGGGAVMNQGVHYVDLIRWLMGPVDSITALCATQAHEGIEVEDVALATLRFASGAVGLIQATTVAYPGFAASVSVTGTGGTIVVEDGVVTTEELLADRGEVGAYGTGAAARAADRAAKASGVAAAADPAALADAGHIAQLADFLDAIDHDREPLVSGAEGRATLALVRALYDSADTATTITLGAAERASA